MSWGGNLISAIRFWVFALGLHDFSRGQVRRHLGKAKLKQVFLSLHSFALTFACTAQVRLRLGKAKLKQVLFVFALGLH